MVLGSLVQTVTVVGSSMGASIIWAYIELYGHDRLAQAIFVDQVIQAMLPERLVRFGEPAMMMGPSTVGR